MNLSYPESLEIDPVAGPIHRTVQVPGSKSITNRALILAALQSSYSDCTLHNVLHSEDTEVMINALQQLGITIQIDGKTLRIARSQQRFLSTDSRIDLFVANSGTSMRFLTALVSLGTGPYRLDGIPRMRERPIEDLLTCLQQLGVDAQSEKHNGCPPVLVNANGLLGGKATIRGDISSQFLSAILMVAPWAKGAITIEQTGVLVSEPYIEMTLAMLQQWGISVEVSDQRTYHIQPHQGHVAEYTIEPDASAASYFFASAAICGGSITIEHLHQHSLQGDVFFVNALEQMGCQVEWNHNSITVTGKPLHGIDIDMNAISDMVMTLGVVACFAQGPTTIRNVAHIRHKETDRLSALATELRKVGAEVEEQIDGLTIHPRPLHGAQIDTYNDHRMAMSLALVGLNVPGIVIRNPGCVAKTYPGFWQDFGRLNQKPIGA